MTLNIGKHRARMLSNGSNIGESLTNSTKSKVESLFKNSPSYHMVKVNGVDTDCRIFQVNSTILKSELYKELSFLPNTQFPLGSLVEYKNKHWMITDFVDNEVFPRAKIQKCNHNLKWQRNNTIHSYPTVVFSRTAYKDDVYPDKVMTLASGQYQLYIARDENSLNLKIDDRFFIGRDIYEIAYIDEITLDGILIFTLNKGQFNAAKDNAELGVADYVEVTEDDTQTPPTNNGGGWW